jgi:hypothetical protein
VGALVDDVARVQRGGGLEEQEPAFFIGYGFVFDAAGYDHELSFFNPFVMFAKVFIAVMHAEAAFDDEKQFIFMLVVVEDKLAFDFVELDALAVEFGGDVGLPEFRDLGELFGNVDFGHDHSKDIIRPVLRTRVRPPVRIQAKLFIRMTMGLNSSVSSRGENCQVASTDAFVRACGAGARFARGADECVRPCTSV